MSLADRIAASSGLDVDPIARVLMASWPAMVTLTPESIGLADREHATADFLRVVRVLSDAGLLNYEALLVGSTGPVLIDATLTARGRAACSDND